MEQEEAIHRGFLLLPPVGKLLKKSWQQKYCLLFKSSKFGIERLEVYDAADSKESKIITLENCIKVHSKTTTTFCITTKTATHEFGALTEHSMNEWLTAIQSVAFPDEVSKITSIEEDNDLYCSSGEGVFNVKLHNSPVSQRCGLESRNYTLVLTSTAIQLRTIIDNRLLFTWPYCYIRRYGYKSGKFTFEAGRKCESGEGTFFLEHPNQQEIFRCLASKMKSMKKLLSGESTPTMLDCGDQLQAALTMEARSRTPLPPSSTIQPFSQESLNKSQISINDLDFGLKTMWMSKTLESSSSGSFTSKSIVSDNDFGQHQKHNKSIVIPKPVPMKPPRKYVPLKMEDDPTYEPVERKFDPVTSSNNNNNNPSSRLHLPADHIDVQNDGYPKQEYISFDHYHEMMLSSMTRDINNSSSSTSVAEAINPTAATITTTTTMVKPPIRGDPEHNLNKAAGASPLLAPTMIIQSQSMTNLDDKDGYYDKLNFFGSTSKLNSSSGYNQVFPIPIPPVVETPKYNHYDEVDVTKKPSDEMIIKVPAPPKDAPPPIPSRDLDDNAKKKDMVQQVSHQMKNEETYAVISKPKRV